MAVSPPSEETFSSLIAGYPGTRDELLGGLYTYCTAFVEKNLRRWYRSDELPGVVIEHFMGNLEKLVAGARASRCITVYVWGLCRQVSLDYIRAHRPLADLQMYSDERPLVDDHAPPIIGLIADEARFRIECALLRSVEWFRFPKYRRYYEALVEHWIEFLEEVDRPVAVPVEVWNPMLYLLRAVIACPDGHIFQRFGPHFYERRGA